MNLLEPIDFDNLTPFDPMFESKYGVSYGVRSAQAGDWIYGVRSKPENGTSGWYVRIGEQTDDKDFYKPLCGNHLIVYQPHLGPLFELPPGWCFATNGVDLDVWENS